ncbi:MAG: hypothetical protein HYW90_04420 [Candidatus Sungbacteria bacterium]|nr:hypothetical protein [Candidatus Sungbacteria bacterium]
MIDLILLLIFLASVSFLSVLVSQKMPVLTALPEKVLDESFFHRPSRISIFLTAIRPWLEWGWYENAGLSGAEKFLRRVRIWILKSDALVSRLLSRVQERGKVLAETDENKLYLLRDLKDWKKSNGAVDVPVAPGPLSSQKSAGGMQRFFQKKI